MRVPVLVVALIAAVAALPVPANQLLPGSISAPHAAKVMQGTAALVVLLPDPFENGSLTYVPPASAAAVETGMPYDAL